MADGPVTISGERVTLRALLLDEAGARRVEGRTDPYNIAMQKVFERLGWTFAGELEDSGRSWLLYVLDK